MDWSDRRADGLNRESHVACWDAENARMWVYGGGADLSHYEPDTDSWTNLETFDGPSAEGTNYYLIHDAQADRLILFDGYDGVSWATTHVWSYTISTGTWAELAPSGNVPGGRRWYAACHDTDNRRLFVTSGSYGSGNRHPWNPYYLLNLETLVWTEITGAVPPGKDSSLEWGSTGNQAVYDSERGAVITFGGSGSEMYCESNYSLNLASATWTSRTNVPNGGITNHRAICCNGKVLSMMGSIFPYHDTWEDLLYQYDIASDTWTHIGCTALHPMNVARNSSGATAVVTDEGHVIVCGGLADGGGYGETWLSPFYCALANSFAGPGNRLYASPTHLPTDAAEFIQIYDLGLDAGPMSVAVLNDRAIITEGIAEVPLVWGGCMSNDASDWMYPKAVLISQDGINFYDITQYVCDTDQDVSANVGGIRVNGYLAICCDMPWVEGFYFQMGSPNQGISGAGLTATYTGTIGFTTTDDIERQDLKGIIDQWCQDADAKGHFEGPEIDLDNDAVVDKGVGKVGLPATGHGLSSGQYIGVYGTTNYNGSYFVDASTSLDEIVVTAAYTPETLSAQAKTRRRLTLGPGQSCPDVETGMLVWFIGGYRTIIDVASDGEQDQEVELSGDYPSDSVLGVYGVDVLANVYDLKGAVDQWHQDMDANGHFEGEEQDFVNAAVINLGNGRVLFPATGHGLLPGDYFRVYGTTNYNKSYVVEATTTSTGVVVTETYVAETFTAAAKFRKRLTLGSGNDCPDVAAGFYVVFVDGTLNINGITSEGELDNEVQLSEVHGSANVIAMYDPAASGNAVSVNHVSGTATTLLEKTPVTGGNYPKRSIRQILSASEITVSGEGLIVLTIKAGPQSETGYCEIAHCSIVERSGSTANGVTTPTVITFKGGQPAVSLSPNEAISSDDIEFAIDETKSYLVSFDLSYRTVVTTKVEVGFAYAPGAHDISMLAASKGVGYHDKPWDLADTHACYDKQTVSGFTGVGVGGAAEYVGGCLGVIKLESKTAHPVPTAMFVSHTTDSSRFDISLAEDFVGVEVLQTTPGASAAYHAVSFDACNTFKVCWGGIWRETVRYSGGNWQYKNAFDVWQTASANTLLQALRQALEIADNRMTKEELEAITAEEWKADGGITLHQGALDFAQALQADGSQYPAVNGYRIIYGDAGTTVVEGWRAGRWDDGEGAWTDNTRVDEVPLAQSGSIMYNRQYFEGDYKVLSEVPGYWWRFKTNGTSANTSITRILYKAPCQPLANIGDGQPDTPLGFIFYDTSQNLIRDYTVEVSDNTLTEMSKADVPMTVEDHLYCGYLTRFSEMEATPYDQNNANVAGLAAQYWNGEQWTSLAIVDGTSVGGKTLAKKGKISWTIPDDWKMSIPLEARFPRGYWLRFNVSAGLSANAAISEVRVYAVPDPVVKHKFAVAAKDRVALLGRPDAPDQCDISRSLEEYGFSGPDSASYRIGGMDSIQCAVAGWNGLFVGKAETWHQLVGNDPSTFNFEGVEAARHVPANSRVIVKAPLSGADGGGRYGMFYLNRFGAFISTGLHTDSAWNTGRSAVLSDSVTWWDERAPVRLDLKNLHIACGEYWPVKNWVIWSVPMTLDGTPQTFNNRLIIYDLTLQAWLPPFTISVASLSCVHHHAAKAPGKLGEMGLYGGDYAGRILRLFGPTDATDLGEPVKAWVETGWLHMGSPQWLKLIRRIQLYGQTQPARTITIKIWKDGNADASKPDKTLLLEDLAGGVDTFFSREEESANVQGRFFKFRIEFNDVAQIFGLQIGFSLVREWGAL